MTRTRAPSGFWGVLLILGPSLIWCGEYIGSGEVILATRTGAILGPLVMWAIVGGIFFKFWIGLCGARYTVATGEGMIDLFSRVPGPKNWLVWVVLVGQAAAGICAIGAIVTASSAFLAQLVPLGTVFGTPWWGVIVTGVTFTIAWSEGFRILKAVMALLVGVIVVGVLYVAAHCLPSVHDFFTGLFGFQVPEIPDWAQKQAPDIGSKWGILLPLIGWSAGGFASQVWYTYWVLGAGYGMARERKWGEPADEKRLRSLSRQEAEEVRPWLKVVSYDATVALVIGTVVTVAFLVAGSGILHGAKLVPQKETLVSELARVFSEHFSSFGGTLFIAAGAAAMISTQIGQLAGWPRLLADCVRNLFRPFRAIAPRTQFRLFLSLFLVTNLLILKLFGTKPLILVTIGALTDGLLLVPLQAIAIAWALFVGQKRLLSKEAWEVLKLCWYHAAGLILAFLIFGYFCVLKVPGEIHAFVGKLLN